MFLDNLQYSSATINFNNNPHITLFESNWGESPSHYIRWNRSFKKGESFSISNPCSIEFLEAGHTTSGRKVDFIIDYKSVSVINPQLNGQYIDIGIFNRKGLKTPTSFAFFLQAPDNAAASIHGKIDTELTIRYNDTKEPVSETAQFTFADLDGSYADPGYETYNEGVQFTKGFTQTYVRKDTVLDKEAIASSGNTVFRAQPDYPTDDTNVDERYFVSAYMEKGHGMLSWFSPRNCGTEIGMEYKGYPEWNAPEKKAASGDIFNAEAPVTYEISQFLPYTAQTNQASNVTISDALPDIFDISKTSAKILNGMREDVSAKWNITISPSMNTVTAQAKEAYESLGQHYLIIETSIKQGADISQYMVLQESKSNAPATSLKAIIDNTAETTINDTTKKSNTTRISSESYPLLYDLNGGDDKGTATDIYLNIEEALSEYRGFHIPGEDMALSTGIPSRDGYVFLGWTEQQHAPSDGKEEYDELSSKTITNIKMPSEQKTIYAAWARKPTVKYIVDGIEESSQQLAPGDDGPPPTAPSKQGYTFSGWSDSAVNVYEDMEIIAAFTPNRYAISYDSNGGSGYMDDQTMTYDEEDVVKQNEYAREHYEFVEWNTEPDGTGIVYAPGETVKNLTGEANGKITLYAQWKFYIQMPETGSSGNMLITVFAFALIMTSIVFALRTRK